MFNNPMMYGNYMAGANMARPGLLGGLFGSMRNINWSGILTNTQKTLGIINQTIPIVYQVKPMINNAKTMFKIADTIRQDDNETANNNQNDNYNYNTQEQNNYNENKPIFYI